MSLEVVVALGHHIVPEQWLLKCDALIDDEPCIRFIMVVPKAVALVAADEIGVSEARLVRALAAGYGWYWAHECWLCPLCAPGKVRQ